MKRNKLGLAMLSCIAMAMISSQANAQLLFNFDNDSPFDGDAAIGASQAATTLDGEPAPVVVNVTTVDILAPEFADDGTGVFVPTGNTLSASAGDGVTTQTNSNSLGVNNPSISDDDFFAGAGIENRDINDGEAWVIEFDVDVSFTELDLSSFDDGTLTVTIDGMGTFIIEDLDILGDRFEDPFGLDFIPAGTDITFAFSSPTVTDSSFRINGFTVTDSRQEFVLGDVDLSGTVDFLDISPFIALLTNGEFQAEADIDGSGEVDFLDISPFISLLSGN